MNLDDKIKQAAQIVLGSVPSNWLPNMSMLVTEYESMPEIKQGYRIPYTTFLLYVLGKSGINNQFIWAAQLVKQIPSFVATYDEMKAIAESTTKLDVLNMQAEMNAYDSLEHCIVEPKLAISPLYRYIVAQDTNMELLLTDYDTNKAIKQLRENPYFYLEYPNHTHLMPITWEEL